MRLHEIYSFKEEQKKRKRIGRGVGSGRGGTSTKGHKGQNARSGGGVRAGFEGGQMPLQIRLPKGGFKNSLFKQKYYVINVDTLLMHFPNELNITIDHIYSKGLCKKNMLVKLLGNGNIDKAITVQVHACSKKTHDMITQAGGKIEVLGE